MFHASHLPQAGPSTAASNGSESSGMTQFLTREVDGLIPGSAASPVDASPLPPSALNTLLGTSPDASTRPVWVPSNLSEHDDVAFLSAMLEDKHAKLRVTHTHLAKAEELYKARHELCEAMHSGTLQAKADIGMVARYKQKVESLRDEIAARESEYDRVLGLLNDVAFPAFVIEDIAGPHRPRLPPIPATPRSASPFEAYIREAITPEARLPFKYWGISCIPSEKYPDERSLPLALQDVVLDSHGALWINQWAIPRPREGYIVFVCRSTQQFATQKQLDILTKNRPLEVVIARKPNGTGFDYVGSFQPLQRWSQFVNTTFGNDFPELLEGFSETDEDDVRWKDLIAHWLNQENGLVFQVFKHVGFNREYYSQLELLARPEKRQREDLDVFSSRGNKRARYTQAHTIDAL